MRAWLPLVVVALAAAAIGYVATIAATPRVLMTLATNRLAKPAGVNLFLHAPLADAASRVIVRPSPDLAYSSCVVDVSNGPVAVTAASIPARYWSLSIFDRDTDVAFVRNNQETSGQPIVVVVARTDQKTPPGATVVRLKGDRGVALIRALVEGAASFAAIDAARRGSTCGVAR